MQTHNLKFCFIDPMFSMMSEGVYFLRFTIEHFIWNLKFKSMNCILNDANWCCRRKTS